MPSRDHSPFSRQKPPPGCQIDWGHPLARGLELAWMGLERGGAAIQDVTRKASPGLMTNVPWGATPFGMGWSFGSANCRIASAASIETSGKLNRTGAQPFTHEASFSVTTKPAAGKLYALTCIARNGYNDAVTGQMDKILGIDENGHMRFSVFSTTDHVATGTTDVTDGRQHHAVGTYDGLNVLVYVDGKLEGSTTSPGSFTETAPAFFICSNINTSTGATLVSFTGYIFHVRAWSIPITAQQVALLYNEPFAMLRGSGRSAGKAAA